MVQIRLARIKTKGEPFYRVVVVDSKKSTQAVPQEVLGFWNKREGKKEIDKKAIEAWVKKGAQVTPAVEKLIA